MTTAAKTKLNLSPRQREFYKLIQQHGPATLEQLTELFRKQYGKPNYKQANARQVLEAMACDNTSLWGDNDYVLVKIGGVYSIRPEDERQELKAKNAAVNAERRERYKAEQEYERSKRETERARQEAWYQQAQAAEEQLKNQWVQNLVKEAYERGYRAALEQMNNPDTSEVENLNAVEVEAIPVQDCLPATLHRDLPKPAPAAKPKPKKQSKGSTVGTASKDTFEDGAKKGYRRGQNHGRAKLTAAQVEQVWSMLASGLTQAKIADAVGVSRATIAHIKTKRIWAHLTNTLPSLN